ncbi:MULTISPECIES: DAK2 domain-containing protein [Mumia]|uniref:DAK2 domain-containing protein n=1 Tax=Mumia TaxID=1546255 RepID=UPI001424348D|nr:MULTISPECIES: DAK2 domain-containing protein [unclassified Mumia]QMW67626.1 DAK2 domain-containing protein [Mumia sp. ZJ1417]
MTTRVSSESFARWALACTEALGSARAEIDALNVFPVPDGDTGTNVYVTFESALQAISAPTEGELLATVVKEYVDAVLLGARGNSGVIMAQLLRASLPLVAEAEGSAVDVARVADAMSAAAAAAYAAVGHPVEGTILTVACRAAEAAQEAVADGADLAQLVSATAAAAREALQRTPEQLDRLARAGVVDAGGRALVVVLDTTERLVTGRFVPAPEPVVVPRGLADDGAHDLHADGPSYEVMYLLDADDTAIPALRQRLDDLGDSLVVVGGDRLWNVHVHVDDVGAAIEAGIDAGRPYRISVTHFAEMTPALVSTDGTRAVVAIAAGPGLASLFSEAGAVVVATSVGAPLAVSAVLDTILDCGADDVVVLPNSRDFRVVCDAAAAQAREAGVHATVIPSWTQVQGLAAVAVHDPTHPFDDDVVAMTSAARGTQHGAITVATESGMTMAGPCLVGDVLGVVDAEFSMVGHEQAEVARLVLDRLMTGSAELVTLVTGDGLDDDVVPSLERWLRARRPDVELVSYTGGQARYPLLLAVE